MDKKVPVFLKQPWFYILCAILLLIFVLHPLANNSEILYSFLPESWYYAWEEFAIIHMKGVLLIAALILWLFAIVCSFYKLFIYKILGKPKKGKATPYVLLVFLSFFVLVALLPPLGCAREKARRISCSSNLKQLFLALQEYANDFEQNLPPKLKTLSDTDYMTDEGIYRCPSRWRKKEHFSDYLYLGAGRKLDEKPAFPLLRDRDKNHPGRYKNILMSDGKVLSNRK